MARTKLFFSPQQKLLPLLRSRRWLQRELDELETSIAREQAEKLSAYGARLDRGLMKDAFAACDKASYAQYRLDEELQRYDVRQNMDRRAVNQKYAKEIFRAIAKGEQWQPFLAQQRRELAALEEKRAEKLRLLMEEKARFVAKNPRRDEEAYRRSSEAARTLYEKRQSELEAEGKRRQEARKAKLETRIAALDRKISALRQRTTTQTLGEDVLLRVDGLKMYFGGLKAVDDVSFEVKKGEIFGLIGPNGAGKTTVFNCITRFYDATDGQIHFVNKEGEVVNLRDFRVHDVILQGITRTFQNVELVREISVLDNLLVASTREYRANLLTQVLGLPSLRREEIVLKEKAKRVLKFMGLESYANWLAFGLPYGILKKVEIARALMSDARLIIMDEPAAGLNDSETAELTETIRRIRDEFGVTILLVEHDMSLVMNVCDTVCAISFGKMLAVGSCEEIKKNKAVQEAYLGVEGDAE